MLAEAGLDRLGVLAAGRYDELVPAEWRSAAVLPEARTALVIGSGGRALWHALTRTGCLREGDGHPVDAHTRRALSRLVSALEAEGRRARSLLAFETLGGVWADFVALGRAAGLGAASRLGLLLDPETGPWLSIRALVLTDLALPAGASAPHFDPCPECPAPCLEACPGSAPQPEGFDLLACDRGRARTPACDEACAARRACPIGASHAYLSAAEAHHMRFR